jgi:hypothetical protein
MIANAQSKSVLAHDRPFGFHTLAFFANATTSIKVKYMDWKNIWQLILVTAISQGVIFSILGYFGKRIFEFSISKSLELKKHELNKELENFKLKLTLLQGKRLEVIESIYKNLIDLRDSIYFLTEKLKFSSGNFDEEEKKKIQDTENKYNAFIKNYNYNKIYLSVDTCATLDKIRDMFWKSAYEYSQIQRDIELGISGQDLKVTYLQASDASDFIRAEVPGVLETLENDFRKIVGVDISAKND